MAAVVLLALMVILGLFGCSDSAPPKGPNAADRAQKDPMNYGPHYGRTDIAPKSSNVNDRGGLQRELHDFLNP